MWCPTVLYISACFISSGVSVAQPCSLYLCIQTGVGPNRTTVSLYSALHSDGSRAKPCHYIIAFSFAFRREYGQTVPLYHYIQLCIQMRVGPNRATNINTFSFAFRREWGQTVPLYLRIQLCIQTGELDGSAAQSYP